MKVCFFKCYYHKQGSLLLLLFLNLEVTTLCDYSMEVLLFLSQEKADEVGEVTLRCTS